MVTGVSTSTPGAMGNEATPEAPVAPSPPLVAANPSRLADDLRAIAQIGALPGGGVTRPGFSTLEREAHELVAGWLSDLGLTIRVDPAGNTIAERSGRLTGPFIAIGSHLDSVPQGGRFDG